MTYAIDEMAGWMWIFIFVLVIAVIIAALHFAYVWVAEDPCRAYRIVAHWWGPIGDHCVGY